MITMTIFTVTIYDPDITALCLMWPAYVCNPNLSAILRVKS